MNRKAILIVSFGTSHRDTREKTIDQIELDIENEYSEYSIYRAFTSKVIIGILKKRDDIDVLTVSEAMEQMKKDGIKEVIIQPTHLLNGFENKKMIREADLYKDDFDSVLLGMPLLNSTEDYQKVIKAFLKEMPIISENEAVVCMGHGTEHYTNASYAALNYMFNDYGCRNVYIGTVEAYPSLEDIMKDLKRNNYDKITLVPFMIVSGDHAKNDMAGEKEDSWKSVLKREGFKVECRLEGLGENREIRRIFSEHIKDALKTK